MKSILVVSFLLGVLSCEQIEIEQIEKENLEYRLDITKALDKIKSFTNEDSLKIKSFELLRRHPNNQAKISEQIAHVFYVKGNLYLTKLFFKKSADSYLALNDKLKYAEQLTNVGVVNELTGDNPKAIKNYHKALTVFNEFNEELKCSYVYNNLGIVYQKFGDFENSMLNYKKSLAICLKLDKRQQLISKYNNIGSLFEKIDGNIDSSLFYYLKANEISTELNSLKVKVVIEANIANIYINKGELNKADSLLDKVYKDSEDADFNLNTINKFKAELLLKQSKFFESEELAKRVIFDAKSQNYKDDEMYATKILIDNYVEQRKFKEAYNTLSDYLILKDEIIGLEQKNEVERLNVKFAVQEKDSHIKLLEIKEENSKKRNLIFYIIITVIISFLLTLLYVLNLQKKHSIFKIKMMQNDITRYIKQIHNFEEELHEQELTHHELFLQKIKQFDLTEREEEVLLQISNGLKNTEIAEIMYVSINTIKTHIKNIFVKLDVRNRIEATNKAKVG